MSSMFLRWFSASLLSDLSPVLLRVHKLQVVGTGRATCLGSAFEGNYAPKSRIREAILSGFDVTSKPVFESRVSCNRHNEVVPAISLVQ